MSINFQDPMNEEARKMLEEMFGDGVAAMDDKMALVNEKQFLASQMSELARAAKQPVVLEIHENGDILELSDGTQYEVTSRGWRKVQ